MASFFTGIIDDVYQTASEAWSPMQLRTQGLLCFQRWSPSKTGVHAWEKQELCLDGTDAAFTAVLFQVYG